MLMPYTSLALEHSVSIILLVPSFFPDIATLCKVNEKPVVNGTDVSELASAIDATEVPETTEASKEQVEDAVVKKSLTKQQKRALQRKEEQTKSAKKCKKDDDKQKQQPDRAGDLDTVSEVCLDEDPQSGSPSKEPAGRVLEITYNYWSSLKKACVPQWLRVQVLTEASASDEETLVRYEVDEVDEKILLRPDGTLRRHTDNGDEEDGQWRDAGKTQKTSADIIRDKESSSHKDLKRGRPSNTKNAGSPATSVVAKDEGDIDSPRRSARKDNVKPKEEEVEVDPEREAQIKWTEEDPTDDLKKEKQLFEKTHFVTKFEAAKLEKGKRLIVLSDGGWCKAVVELHEQKALSVKWIGFPKEPLFSIDYKDAAIKMSKDIKVEDAREASKALLKMEDKIEKIQNSEELTCGCLAGLGPCSFVTKDPKRLTAHRKLMHKREKLEPGFDGISF